MWQTKKSVFLHSPEEILDILLRLGWARRISLAYIEAISGFRFYGRQIRKSGFAKVGSCELN